MPYAEIHGINIHYEVRGSGPPLLMIAPGGFDSTIEKSTTSGVWSELRLQPPHGQRPKLDFRLIYLILVNPMCGSFWCHPESFGYAQDKLREWSGGWVVPPHQMLRRCGWLSMTFLPE